MTIFQLFNRGLSYTSKNLHTSSKKLTAKPSPLIDSIIRVDHAGELGADRIYAGQMAVLGNTKVGPLIQHMWDQEKVHKATFESLIVKYRVRPTALVPIWNVAGFLLGAGTALMGEKAAMACTVAVESVIVDHYNDQLRNLMTEPEKNKELMETIQKFRDDEQEHHDHGIDQGAEKAPFYKALSEIIKFGCKTAIAISKELLNHQNQVNKIFNRQYCTSNIEKKKWDLFSGVCLERKPVILKPLSKFEQKVINVLTELEEEQSMKSDFEIEYEESLKKIELIKQSEIHFDELEQSSEKNLYEMEEEYNKELKAFKFSSRLTWADKEKNLKSVERKLSNHLVLLLNENFYNSKKWLLPTGIRKDSETMRETAERVLREKCGNDLKVLFLGNAPCGFYKYKYPKTLVKDSYGAKIFFFKAIYFGGQVEINAESDYQWATRSELKSLLLLSNIKYFKKVSEFLIEEEEVEEVETLSFRESN